MNRPLKEGSDDEPVFDLPLENELLVLKLKAEFGAECSSCNAEIPPTVVNEFLRSVYEFEKKFRGPRKTISVFEKIGKPFFRYEGELNDKLVSRELNRINEVLRRHHLQFDVLGTYPDRTIYKFITEVFFYHMLEDIDLPGYVHHFYYEDFHANHESDIREQVVEFLSQWFSRMIGDYQFLLADPFIHPDTREFSREEVLEKISRIFEAHQSYTNCEYLISQVQFDWNHERGTGRAFVQGKVRYDAMLENGEVVHHEGPIELYLSHNGVWWSIFYFVFPGFSWSR